MTDQTRVFKVDDLVEFHCEWPFEIVYGRVFRVWERKREFGDGNETVVTVAWEQSYTREESITTVPTWNYRLKHRRRKNNAKV